MGLRKIRHQVVQLCWRLLAGTDERAPERTQIPQYDCRATACDSEKSEDDERRPRLPVEDQEQVLASFASAQRRADVQGNGCHSASHVAQAVLGPNASATICNVLVLGTQGSSPLKRTKILFVDAKEVPAIFNSLVIALQRNGFDCRAVQNPKIPVTEIWLTSPLHDGNRALLSCAATPAMEANERVTAAAASPQDQPQ